jgi:hypothetical protein
VDDKKAREGTNLRTSGCSRLACELTGEIAFFVLPDAELRIAHRTRSRVIRATVEEKPCSGKDVRGCNSSSFNEVPTKRCSHYPFSVKDTLNRT